MNPNPKIEFYRFKLNHKSEEFKTFKDFVKEVLKGRSNIDDNKVTESILKHFLDSLKEDISKDEISRKKISLEKKPSINSHLDKKPTFLSDRSIIHGVINGGPYGRDGVIADFDDDEKSEKLDRKKVILLYYYFLLYIPSDHNEGCFIIQSNSTEDTITGIFRNYIKNLFSGGNYKKPEIDVFCPSSFQEEFKKGAVIQNIIFQNTFIESIPDFQPIKGNASPFEIRIQITPVDKTIEVNQVEKIKNFFDKKLFGSLRDNTTLNHFVTKKLTAKNDVTKAQKLFEWNDRDNEFVPTIYLKNRVPFNNGSPNFKELSEFCLNIMNDEVIPNLRPDLNVIKVK